MIGAIIGKKLVLSKYADLNNRDVEAFTAGWREDATFIYPDNVSVGGEIKGKKAIDEWFQKYMERFPEANITVKKVYTSNIFSMTATNSFAVEWDEKVTSRDGKDFQFSGITTIQVINGKANLVRDYIYNTGILKEVWGE